MEKLTYSNGDRRWLWSWLAGGADQHDSRQLFLSERLRLGWWGLRGGRKLQRFREAIEDGRGLRAAYAMARRASNL